MTATATASSSLADTGAALDACVRTLLRQLGGPPSQVVCVAAARHAPDRLATGLGLAFPAAAIHGLSSCLGPTTAGGLDPGGLALFAIADRDGAYGSACLPFRGDPRTAARLATIAACQRADRPGERPDLLLVSSTPGPEEAVIAGIQDAVGSRVPIIGGSAADDAIAGAWFAFDAIGAGGDRVAISAWYPSCRIGHRFHSGYDPTGITGLITAAEGRRLIEIDGIPAGLWYNCAREGASDANLARDGVILMDTTLAPLGRIAGTVSGIPHYLLSHPERLLPDGSLSLFTEIAAGETVELMRGSLDSLASRAGLVAAAARPEPATAPLGALVVYCAGCMLTVRERMPAVAAGLAQALDGAPFLGMHTFGEQGCFVDGTSRHGNLMISTIVLSP